MHLPVNAALCVLRAGFPRASVAYESKAYPATVSAVALAGVNSIVISDVHVACLHQRDVQLENGLPN